MKPQKKCLVCGEKQKFRFKKREYGYYQCKSCGLLSTYPIPEYKTIEEHYVKNFEDGNYEQLRYFMRYYINIYRDLAKRLENTLRSYNLGLNGLKTLDIGCFTGELIELLKEKGADGYGLELQDKAVEIANKKLPGRVFKADVLNNNFPQMKFDVVMLLAVIEHVVDPIKLLRRSIELLNPGGILMLQTPNSSSFPSRILGRYWSPCTPVEHIHLFSKESLKQTLRDMGLEHIVFKHHWKRLPLVYIYNVLRIFEPEIFKIIKPFYNFLPKFFLDRFVPFYIGEIVVFARKP